MLNATIIYIVDDDPDDQNFLIDAIKEIDLSIECYTAINGQEGLQRLETAAVPFPTIIFLDLNMPRIDGRKFLTTIKQHPKWKTIPVVIHTTSTNENEKLELLNLGAAAYLVKQSDPSFLRDNLSEIIARFQ